MKQFNKNNNNISVFKTFSLARYFVILGFLFSTILLNFSTFLPFFEAVLTFNEFQILSLNFFLFSLFFFILSFSLFFFLFRNKIRLNKNYKKNLKWIFGSILFAVLINLLFLLKFNELLVLKISYMFIILFPIHIVVMFIAISLSVKIFHDWQKTLIKKTKSGDNNFK